MKNVTYTIVSLLLISLTASGQPTDRRHIYVSKDYGNTWQAEDNGFPDDDGVNAMVLHRGRVVAATGKHGIWMLEKGSWYSQSLGLPREARVISLLSHQQFLFAGVYRTGLYYSSDGGSSWMLLRGGPQMVNVRAIAFYDGDIYAGTDAGIYQVSLHGAPWKHVLSSQQINDLTADSGYLYAATHRGVARSANGETWEPVFAKGAMSKVVKNGNNIIAVDYSGNVYKTPANAISFVRQDTYLPRPYLRLTPVSDKMFVHESSGIATFGIEPRPGLPPDVYLNVLLQTPDGLIAAGPNGC